MSSQITPYPCPYCKQQPDRGYYGPSGFYIECGTSDCKERPSIEGRRSSEQAVIAWNRLVGNGSDNT